MVVDLVESVSFAEAFDGVVFWLLVLLSRSPDWFWPVAVFSAVFGLLPCEDGQRVDDVGDQEGVDCPGVVGVFVSGQCGFGVAAGDECDEV